MQGGILGEPEGVRGSSQAHQQELLLASQAGRDTGVRFIIIYTFHLCTDECFLYQIYCGEQMKIHAIRKE